MIVTEPCQYQKTKIYSCIWKDKLIPAFQIPAFLNTCYYLDVGLKICLENMDVQPAFKALTSMYQYLWKTEDHCPKAMKQVVK